ncbi:MAG: hypothetical protein HRU38_16255 [Saccharospirillaceae bacterium]|nr:hypothetical protein [Saccharospirillaceae bacterium]
MKILNVIATLLLVAGSSTVAAKQDSTLTIKHTGVLEFSNDGTLFVGDNVTGAIFAYPMEGKTNDKPVEINIANIDAQIAAVMGVGQHSIIINDMAVHPLSQEVYLSITRGIGVGSLPGIVKVSTSGELINLPLYDLENTAQILQDMPDKQRLRKRGMMAEANNKDLAKYDLPMSTYAILDIEYYKGEIFVAGISNEMFASTLRRMQYPFKGTHSSSQVTMYHTAHNMYESRAPIRQMLIKEIDGKAQMIAAYTCSPIVLIPLDQIKDGAKITASTVLDYGNGEPIDMVSYKHPLLKKEVLFLTAKGRNPQIIPLDALNNALVLDEKNTPDHFLMDGMGLPIGPSGFTTMFVGKSTQLDVLNPGWLVSLTRDSETGTLDMQSLPSWFPITIHNLVAEFDFADVNLPEL